MKRLSICALMCGLASAAANAADDVSPSSRGTAGATDPPSWSWFYLGGHLGDAWGHSDWTGHAAGGQPAFNGSFDFYQAYDASKGTGSYFSGLQAGYNHRLPAGIVLGVEADVVRAARLQLRDGFARAVTGREHRVEQ